MANARSSSPSLTDPKNGTPEKKKGSRTATFIILAIVAVLAGAFIIRTSQAMKKQKAFADERSKSAENAKKPREVHVVHAEPAVVDQRVEITGTLKPWREADLAFEVSGRLATILVKAGDTVKEGQIIAALDGTRVGAQLNQAGAAVRAAQEQLALATDELARAEALVATKSIPQAQADQARRQVELLKAQLEGARASAQVVSTGRNDHVLVAPFSGLVTKAPTSAGGVISPGVPLVHIEDVSRFRLSASISEEDVHLVRVGAQVTVRTLENQVNGVVTVLVPSLDQATRRAPVEIEVPNDPKAVLLAWSFVRASINGSHKVNVFKLTGSARRPGGQDEIVRVVDGTAKITKVVASVDPSGSLLIREGITESDVIVDSPDKEIHEGDGLSVLAGAAQ